MSVAAYYEVLQHLSQTPVRNLDGAVMTVSPLHGVWPERPITSSIELELYRLPTTAYPWKVGSLQS